MKKIVNMFVNDYSTAHWQRKVSFWIIFVAIPVMIVAGGALFGKNTPGDIIVFCAAILGGLFILTLMCMPSKVNLPTPMKVNHTRRVDFSSRLTV